MGKLQDVNRETRVRFPGQQDFYVYIFFKHHHFIVIISTFLCKLDKLYLFQINYFYHRTTTSSLKNRISIVIIIFRHLARWCVRYKNSTRVLITIGKLGFQAIYRIRFPSKSDRRGSDWLAERSSEDDLLWVVLRS